MQNIMGCFLSFLARVAASTQQSSRGFRLLSQLKRTHAPPHAVDVFVSTPAFRLLIVDFVVVPLIALNKSTSLCWNCSRQIHVEERGGRQSLCDRGLGQFIALCQKRQTHRRAATLIAGRGQVAFGPPLRRGRGSCLKLTFVTKNGSASVKKEAFHCGVFSAF